MAQGARCRSPVPGRTVLVLVMLAGVAVTGCNYDEPLRPVDPSVAPAVVSGGAEDADRITRWDRLNDDSLWTHIVAAQGLADVGLRPPGRASGMERGRVTVARAARASYAAALRAQKGVQVLSVDTLLPILKVRLENRQALANLRRLPHVQYVEPGAFTNVNNRRGFGWNDIEFGCSVTGYSGPGNYYITPGDVLPWNYRYMKIDSAWAKTSGKGVTIGIVDTGIDEKVPELNGYFQSGMSSARHIIRLATKPNVGSMYGWHDTCGHGTRMASVVAGPRNGIGTLGVAWGANLLMVRVDDDVILTEVEATRLGIRLAAQNAQVVAMAFGTYAHYSSIAQELEYWYFNSQRILIAAAGTTACWDPNKWITFPGTLSTVWTVTGFDQHGLACNSSRGPQVDFAAYTGQPAQGLHTLGSTLAGLHGSSGATAVIAGMAGLYLAFKPGATRADVLSALTYAASPTGGRSPLWGFGVPNALCLVKEMCTAWIEGPNLIQQSGTYTWRIRQAASPGPFAYQWGSGETTETITRYVSVYPGMPESAFLLSMSIRDTRNGRTRTDNRLVVVRYPYDCPTCF